MSDHASTVLITGANRGIGLEFAKQFAKRGSRVIATCRTPYKADDLNALSAARDNVTVDALDVSVPASADALAEQYEGTPIDILLNNAALLAPTPEQAFGAIDYEVFVQSFLANALGPIKMCEAFVDHVAASTDKKMVTLGSAAGSIAMHRPPANLYSYRSSKAALHSLMHNLSFDLADRGIKVGLLNPGLADTRGLLDLDPDDPGPEDLRHVVALARQGIIEITPVDVAVRGMIEIIDGLSADQAGQFLNFDGVEIPW